MPSNGRWDLIQRLKFNAANQTSGGQSGENTHVAKITYIAECVGVRDSCK